MLYFKSGFLAVISKAYRSLPKRMTSVIDVVRSYYPCFFNSNLPVFVHVPKNGGSYVSKLLYGRQILHCRVSDIRRASWIYGSPQIIAIYRDPILRFVSAANFVRMGGTSYLSSDYYSYYQDIDFDDIDSFVRVLSSISVDQLDHVFRPQSYYINEYVSDVEVYSIDMIDSLLSKYVTVSSDCCKVNVSHKFFSKSDLSYSSLISLRKMYAVDYSMINYYGNPVN